MPAIFGQESIGMSRRQAYFDYMKYMTTQTISVDIWGFVINLVLAAVLALILARIFVKRGSVLSNRTRLAANFVLLTLTTMFIITVVKSSMALSLGLVGALSIVRFRTAIKEPEELAYLFVCIAIGLGLGANQRLITVTSFAVLVTFILVRHVFKKGDEGHNLFLTVTGQGSDTPQLAEIVATLKESCSAVDLRRFDDNGDSLEALFAVEFESFEQLEAARASLRELGDSLRITLLDNRGIV